MERVHKVKQNLDIKCLRLDSLHLVWPLSTSAKSLRHIADQSFNEGRSHRPQKCSLCLNIVSVFISKTLAISRPEIALCIFPNQLKAPVNCVGKGMNLKGNYSQQAIFQMKNHPVQLHSCIKTPDNMMMARVSLQQM